MIVPKRVENLIILTLMLAKQTKPIDNLYVLCEIYCMKLNNTQLSIRIIIIP